MFDKLFGTIKDKNSDRIELREVREKVAGKEETISKFYKMVFDNMPFIAFTLDTKGRLLKANKESERITGLRLKDLKGKSFANFGIMSKKSLLKAFAEFRKNLQGKVTGKTLYKIKLEDGREMFIELIGIPLKKKGKTSQVLIVGEDVTEQKISESRLSESEARYRFFIENMDAVILSISKTGKILYANKKALTLTGYSEKEVVGKSIVKFLTKNSVKQALKALASEFSGKREPELEVEIKTKSGESKRLLIAEGSVPLEVNGKKIGIMIIGHDVTRSKESEERIRESEEKFRLLFEKAKDGLVILSTKGRILNVNQSILEIAGAERNELVDKNIIEVIPRFMGKKQIKDILQMVRKRAAGLPPKTHVLKLKNKKGGERTVSVDSVVIKKSGKIVNIVGTIKDITEQKRAEEKLMESEKQKEFIINNLDAMILTISRTGKIMFGNKKAEEITGYTLEECSGKRITEFLTKASIKPALKALALEFMGRKTPSIEIEIKTKKGEIKTILLAEGSVPIRDNGKITGIMVNGIDITERKKAERKIKESEEKYRKLFEVSPEGIVTANKKGIITSVNTAFCNITGFSKREIEGKHVTKLPTIDKKDFIDYAKLIKNLFSGKLPEQVEFPYRTKKGEKRVGEAKVSVIKKAGVISGFQAVLRDITAEKARKKEMEEAAEKYKFLTNNVAAIIAILSRTGNFIYANKNALETFGYEEKDIIGKSFLTLLTKNSIPIAWKGFLNQIKGKKIKPTELEVKTKTGRIKIIKTIPSITKVEGKETGYLVSAYDVTEEKHTKEKITMTERKTGIYFKQAGNILLTLGPDGRISQINNKGLSTLGYSEKEITGKNWFETCIPESEEDMVQNMFKQILDGKIEEVTKIQSKIITKSGDIRTIDWTNTVIEDSKGRITEILISGNDVTEEKKIQRKIIESEKKFKNLFSSLTDAIFILNPKGKILEVNNVTLERLGYQRQELVNHNISKIYDAENRKKIPERIGKIMREGNYSFETEQLTKHRKKIPVETNATRIEYDGEEAILSLVRDITERKKSEEYLKKRTTELEKFNRLAVGRELKMRALKKQMKELEKQLKKEINKNNKTRKK